MPPNDDAEESSFYYLLSDDGEGLSDNQDSDEGYDEIEDKNKDAGSQVMMGTLDSVDFLMPGGLSSLSVALLVKSGKLVSISCLRPSKLPQLPRRVSA
jgi:hypothetical protein